MDFIQRRKQPRYNKHFIIFLVIISLIVIAVFVSNKIVTRYINNSEEVVEEIDSYQKLADHLAEMARQVQKDEIQVVRATYILRDAKELLASSTDAYNSAIESWDLYQGNLELIN